MILLLAALLAQAATGRTRICDKADATKCAAVNSSGQVSISGTISASTTGRATAAAPSYTEGTDNPLSIDLSGNIRTLATAETAAKATAADPSYTEGTTNPISQDLSGHLRVTGTFWQTTQPVSGTVTANQGGSWTNACTQSGTWTVQPGNTANTTAWKVDGSAVTQPVSGTFWQATQPISAASLPLPTGAATDAVLTGGTQTTKIVNGANTMGVDANGRVSINQLGAGANGSAIAAGSVFVTPAGGYDGANLRVLKTAADGTLRIDPTGTTAQPVSGTFWQATQPVSGTVTTTPPSNASTNVTQWNGTTVDTNSGLKSAGTVRVVLATDQPALTNKLLVTPDSVALPANQSVNVAQFGGTNTVTGTGAGGAGIPRVTISNDSSLAANQSVNVAQMGGVATSMGNGAVDTGTQRVMLAQRVTYSAGNAARQTVVVTATVPWFTICGSGTKTIRIQQIIVSLISSTATAGYADVVLKKTSTATSGGTAVTLTKVPLDSNSAGATANLVQLYSAAATIGTLVGVIQVQSTFFPSTTAAATPAPLEFKWRDTDSESPVLRGTAQCVEAQFGTAPAAAPAVSLSVKWTEE